MRTSSFFLFLTLLIAALSSSAAPRLVPMLDSELATVRSSEPGPFHRTGDLAFFLANGAASRELWRTDDTPAGTIRLAAIPNAHEFVGNVGRVAVVLTNGTPQAVWRSDGTVAGTWKLWDVPAWTSFPTVLLRVATTDAHVYLFLRGKPGQPDELWASSVHTPEFRQIGDPSPTSDTKPIAIGKTLYFSGSTFNLGSHLWISNGDGSGTRVLRLGQACSEWNCNPTPTTLFRLRDEVFFFASDGLFRADTSRVTALDKPVLLGASATTAYFRAGGNLYATDGSASGTRVLAPLPQPRDVAIAEDGALLYSLPESYASKVYRTDGTRAPEAITVPSTVRVESWVGPRGSTLFVSGVESETGTELWAIDLDRGTTTLVSDLDPRRTHDDAYSSQPGVAVSLGTRIVFAATSLVGRELWGSDGTAAGTTLLANLAEDDGAGGVRGTIRETRSGNVVAGASVYLCTTSCSVSTATAADGTFGFDGVAPGTLTVRAFSDAHVIADSAAFEVRSGFVTSDVDLALTRGGRITGKVTRASTQEPLGGHLVEVHDGGGVFVTSAITATDGTYRTRGLAPGAYFVETQRPPSRPIADQVYRNRSCSGVCDALTGDPVEVAAEADVANIDFALRELGTIAGRVRTESGLPVHTFTTVTFRQSALETGATVVADAEGVYQSPPLAPGKYFVTASAVGFSSMVSPNADCGVNACDLDKGTAVEVTLDAKVTGVDFALKQQKGRIVGVILDRTGAPVSGLSLSLYGQNGERLLDSFATARTTDEKGRIVFASVPAGVYHLKGAAELLPHAPCSQSPCSVTGATSIPVIDGQTATPTIALQSQRVTIEGTMRDARTGAVVSQSGSVTLYAATSPHSYVAQVYLAQGRYRLDVFSRETSFYVTATVVDFHPAAHPNVLIACREFPSCVPAGAVAVSAGKSTIDFSLRPSGEIRGVVIDSVTRKPVGFATVAFVAADGRETTTQTDLEGRYRWREANGSYYVYARKEHYAAQVYPGRSCDEPCDPRSGTPVVAADGAEVSIDFSLTATSPVGSVSGRVFDARTGAGIANAEIDLYPRDFGQHASTRTDATGRYVLQDGAREHRLVSGTYTLFVTPPLPYYEQYYGGTYCPTFRDCFDPSAPRITIQAPHETSNIDIPLTRLDATIEPSFGPPEGFNEIVLTGQYFTELTAVWIGDKPAKILVRNPSQLTVLVPPGREGFAHVRIVGSSSHTVTQLHAYEYTKRTAPKRRRGVSP